MIENLKQLRDQATAQLQSVKSIEELDQLVLNFFGRKQGLLNHILRSLKRIDEKQRKILGAQANEVKVEIWRLIDEKRRTIKNQGKKEFIDLTVDGTKPNLGHLHPVTITRREIQKVFREMGFGLVVGHEIEDDYHNFQALNIPEEHPARDMMDTFYLNTPSTAKEKLLLRTHVSSMQARIMKRFKPPFAIASSGRVFRREATDARHEHTYDYTEGFVVGENISFANLKATLIHLFQGLYGPDVEIKFRSSYFPFVEPGAEILMSCIFCNKKGCSICSHTGWLEMAGAGMIHPRLFEYAGYAKDKYSGFAFGGLSRVVMLKYNIPDIRMLYQNDVRFLHQF